VKRSGFSLVELVLSIVVIAIALMTVPLMLGQSAQSNQFSLVQESIMAARTKVGNIISFRWDNNSSEANSSVTRAVDVRGGDSDLNRTGASSLRRKGHTVRDMRRRMTDSPVFATIGHDDFDDIDDFDGNVSVIALTGSGVEGKFDYLDKDLNLTTQVMYISDDANYSATTINFDFNASTGHKNDANSTNIKMIELTVRSSNKKDLPFVFRTFSSNIGQSKLDEKVK